MDRQTIPVGLHLTASTTHISSADLARLHSGTARLDLAYTEHPLGFWVWVPEDLSPNGPPEDGEEDVHAPFGISAAFVDLLRYARRLGCDYVDVNRYGPVIKELPRSRPAESHGAGNSPLRTRTGT